MQIYIYLPKRRIAISITNTKLIALLGEHDSVDLSKHPSRPKYYILAGWEKRKKEICKREGWENLTVETWVAWDHSQIDTAPSCPPLSSRHCKILSQCEVILRLTWCREGGEGVLPASSLHHSCDALQHTKPWNKLVKLWQTWRLRDEWKSEETCHMYVHCSTTVGLGWHC